MYVQCSTPAACLSLSEFHSDETGCIGGSVAEDGTL